MVPKIPINSGSTPTPYLDKVVLAQGGGGVPPTSTHFNIGKEVDAFRRDASASTVCCGPRASFFFPPFRLNKFKECNVSFQATAWFKK